MSQSFTLLKSFSVAPLVLSAAFAVVGVPAAVAQNIVPDAPALMRKGQLPLAALNASASSQVSQDTIKITLAAQVANASHQKVSAGLTQALDSVVKQAKAVSSVKTYSGNYRVWPLTNDEGKITGWQGRAEVILESTDFEAASGLAGQLSDRMSIANLQFSVSPQVRAKAEADLLNDAAQAFKGRAQSVAQAFGYQGFRIKTLSLDGGGAEYAPMPRMMMAASADKMAVPLEAGVETVTVSVRGEVYLLENK
ncbi:SIMPL domain-containing protein [Pusillimonas minor]|uniref:SIMPL domain-containing protein n=1 Tax=Pusillimonas minor TaxID=2697024 RepID=A0A842HT98_9BURK|nr:SIMPL domain-containing protein [Pusillimonas minor]MBC2770868.1 SIMPL domain-containing protein [Pusillimonas minor]